ncbi:MAG: hypothetical protein LBL24_08850 [Bacteroidales bacterium]|nr:hypothetical protein [Bacteroidales bacterium]
MKKIIPLLCIVIELLSLSIETYGKKKPTVDFWPAEASIQQLFRDIRETKDDSLAIKLHRNIEEILAQTLAIPEAYKYKFDSLGMIGKIYAPHKDFCILNWNHSSRDGTYRYFAMIVLPGKKGEPNRVIRLTETTDSIVRPDQQALNPDQWLGCLYYKIIPKKRAKGGKQYYTLLGLDMHNLKTKKKYIEVLSFDPDGNPQFGAPVIELNGWTKHRVIFEFSAQQSMYVEYKWLRRRIEFDHLAPLMPYLVGEYEYYEPDLFRDALKFKGGQWKHIKDVQKPPKSKKLKKSSLPKPPKPKPPTKEEWKKMQQENTEGTENTENTVPDGTLH